MRIGKDAPAIFERLLAAENIEAWSAIIDEMTAACGFTGFIFAHADPANGITAVDRRPEEWQQRFYSKGYYERDPLIIEALDCGASFRWSEALRPASLEQRRILAEATEFGLNDGYLVPLRLAADEVAFMTYFSDHSQDVGDAIAEHGVELDLFALMAYSAFVRKQERPQQAVRLTVREREVMLWAARGKTTAETATIMGISSNTVKAHTREAMRKLDAVNKTQAAVQAARLKLILV